ncbi:MAG: 3-hydroxyacyl-CoA dehydrogenase family protein [Pseudolabrys sp.]
MVQRAAEMPIDEGLAEERAVFQRLRGSETAAALRHLFFAERAAGRVSGTEDAKPRKVSHVGVVGGGTMGAGIAVCFADAGFPVVLIERDPEAVQAASARIRATYDRMVTSGRISADEGQRRAALIVGAHDYAALGDVDLAVEAVFEDIDVKREVFAKLDAVLKPGAILGSNTSYLDLDMLGAQIKRPEAVVGLHFFAPANVMKLLEVVRTKATSAETLATALAVAKKIRKVAVVARVCEGFIGNRIYAAYRREAEILLEEGAYPEQIDAALEAFGFPMGPFAVTDLSGLDIAWRTRKRLAATRDPRERYVPILDRLCEMGRLGRKANAGWYTYSPTPNAARRTQWCRRRSRASRTKRESSASRSRRRRSRPASSVPSSMRRRWCSRMASPNGRATSTSCWSTAMGFPPTEAARCSGPAAGRARSRSDDRRCRQRYRLRLSPSRSRPRAQRFRKRLKFAGRFSMKAVMPSMFSSLP